MNNDRLIARGLHPPWPKGVYVDATVNSERVLHQDVHLFPGCRISGRQTLIANGARIGTEGPVTIIDCLIGPNVEIKSGYFEKSVFLEGACLGYGSHVRAGTILEEQASIAHCVGLKQTILFPFVTLGSQINFCDCLMAGGSSRKNHSEIGSSFVHFNYTPNQDKATASLIGDVPHGVMLNQHPIFLGGQGGLVGPCRIAYGTVSAAGTIVRKDQLRPDHLVFGGAGKGGTIPWKPGSFGAAQRIINNNIIYIGNLLALRAWYDRVRREFTGPQFSEDLCIGLIQSVDLGLEERIKRLRFYIERLNRRELSRGWEVFEKTSMNFDQEWGHNDRRDTFLAEMTSWRTPNGSYLETIKALSPETAAIGTQWLTSIVNEFVKCGSQLNISSKGAQ
jgi:UDP-N-acetylglucosamine/UDP-N-acetylgalactosamine diphosphorylase